MLQGLTTVSHWADDVEAAKQCYSKLWDIEPYFHIPNQDGSLGDTEFRVVDYQHELGLIDRRYAPIDTTASGAVIYWHVTEVDVTLEKLLAMGTQELEAPRDRGSGFITAAAIDTLGNIVGIVDNPHYLNVLTLNVLNGEKQ